MKKLTKNEMKKVIGGDGEVQVPGYCDDCTMFCWSIPGDSTGRGQCPAGSPSTCKNYCCENGQPTRWC